MNALVYYHNYPIRIGLCFKMYHKYYCHTNKNHAKIKHHYIFMKYTSHKQCHTTALQESLKNIIYLFYLNLIVCHFYSYMTSAVPVPKRIDLSTLTLACYITRCSAGLGILLRLFSYGKNVILYDLAVVW